MIHKGKHAELQGSCEQPSCGGPDYKVRRRKKIFKEKRGATCAQGKRHLKKKKVF